LLRHSRIVVFPSAEGLAPLQGLALQPHLKPRAARNALRPGLISIGLSGRRRDASGVPCQRTRARTADFLDTLWEARAPKRPGRSARKRCAPGSVRIGQERFRGGGNSSSEPETGPDKLRTVSRFGYWPLAFSRAIRTSSQATILLVAFSSSAFLGALLLFLVQPMVGKMYLPLLGGSPNVWNTCVLFFQVSLLAGYLFAHILTRKVNLSRQFLVIGALALVSFLVLPVATGNRLPPGRENPMDWLLFELAITVGPPFFLLSTISPLLQRWFSLTAHPEAGDPYFLYASSNAGSLAALLAYPLLFETQFSLSAQSMAWAGGYALLLGVLASSLLLARKAGFQDGTAPSPAIAGAWSPTIGTSLFWLLAAFLPSSLMLAATTAISTNVAPVPFLWVLPLGLYLLTFIFSFMRRPPIPHSAVVRFLPLAIMLVALAASDKVAYRWMGIWSHLLLVFMAGLFCHRELVFRRPSARFLTQFYLWVALGGALGGVFNAIVSPLLFHSVVEYPLVVLLVALFCASRFWRMELEAGQKAVFGVVQLGALAGALYLLSLDFYGVRGSSWATWLVFGLPLAASWLLGRTTQVFAIAVVAVQIMLFVTWMGRPNDLLAIHRNFYGIKKVTQWSEGRYHTLTHGDTSHGIQRMQPEYRSIPLAYYYRESPLGDVWLTLESVPGYLQRAAVLGLGIGTIAAYGQPGQEIHFFELDPAMEEIAREPSYFTYLADSRAQTRVLIGDARLRLLEAPDSHYQLIVMDAFSSDSVPTHLVSLEAIQLMLRKLSPDGLVLFHTSNRYLSLNPVLANAAAELQLLCYARTKLDLSADERLDGKYASSYLVMARKRSHLRGIDELTGWNPVPPNTRVRVWTDDYSSLLPVLRFR
jgi:SAM-dependent methyltransferase